MFLSTNVKFVIQILHYANCVIPYFPVKILCPDCQMYVPGTHLMDIALAFLFWNSDVSSGILEMKKPQHVLKMNLH